MDDIRQKIRCVQNCWNTAIAPAIVQFAVEAGRYHPESDEANGETMLQCPTSVLICLHCSYFNVLVDVVGGQTEAKRRRKISG